MAKRTKEAQALYDYFNGLSNKKEQLKALIELDGFYTGDNKDFFTEEEFQEYEQIKNDFFFPYKKDANGNNIVDKDVFPKMVRLANELSEEDLHAKYDMNLQVQAYLNKNPQTAGLTDDQKRAMAGFYCHNFSEENNHLSNVAQLLTGLAGTERANQMNELMLQDEEALFENPVFINYKENYIQNLFANAQENQEIEIPSDSEIKRDFSADEQYVLYGSEKVRENLSAAERRIADYDSESDKDHLEAAGFNVKQEIEAATLMTTAQKKAAPWKSAEDQSKYRIHKLATHGLAKNLNEYDYRQKMQSLSFLYDKMSKDMKSTFSDNQEYKDMMNALKAVKDKLAELDDPNKSGKVQDPSAWKYNRTKAADALRQASAAAGKYVQTHMTNRTSDLGKNRFDAAMTAIGIVNSDVAMAIADEVNAVRSKEKHPQTVKLDALSEKFGIAVDEPVNYRKFKEMEAMTANPDLDRNKVKAEKCLEFLNNRRKIYGSEEEKKAHLEELKKLGLGAGMEHSHEADRVSNNVLLYMYQKHPELVGENISDLTNTEVFRNAVNEYKDFLRENKVMLKNDASGKAVAADADEKLANLAEYHHNAMKYVTDARIPDLNNPTERRKAMEELFQKYQFAINISQNQQLLGKQGEYINQYPGSQEGYNRDNQKLALIAILGKAAQKIDDKKADFVDRLGGKVMVETYNQYFAGKSIDEIAATDKGAAIIAAAPTLQYFMREYQLEAKLKPADKAACEAYIEGKGPMPESLQGFLNKKAKDIRKATQSVMDDQKQENAKKVEKQEAWKTAQAAKKEKAKVEKITFDKIMHEFQGEKEAPKRSRRNSTAQKSAKQKDEFSIV